MASFSGSPQSGAGGANVTTDARIYYNGTPDTFANYIAVTTGTAVDNGPDSWRIASDASSPKWSTFTAYFLSLDLASVPVGSTITGSPTLKFYVTAVTDNFTQSVGLVASSFTTANNVVVGDYNKIAPFTSATRYATDLTLAGLSLNAYNSFTLNAAGITALQNAFGGVIKLGVRLTSLLDNNPPVWAASQNSTVNFNHAEDANPPVLAFTYTPPSSGGAFFQFQ